MTTQTGKTATNPDFTFESFVVEPGNERAYGAALQVAEAPGKAHNPLFICSAVGQGKTHLLHAIANRFLDESRGTVLLPTAEMFVRDMVTATKDGRREAFRGRYQDVDILLIDSIQYVYDKPISQRELLQILDARYETGKQVVFSSDRRPESMAGIPDDLRARFGAGRVVECQPPGRKIKWAVLQEWARKQQVELPEEVADWLVTNAGPNIRELVGASYRLHADSKCTQTPICMETVRHAYKLRSA